MNPNFRKTMLGLATAAVVAGPTTSNATNDLSAASKAVWEGHLQKAMSRDLDAVMTDFTDQSAILTADKAYVGTTEVRSFLGNVIKGFTPEVVKSIVMQAEVPPRQRRLHQAQDRSRQAYVHLHGGDQRREDYDDHRD